MRKLIASAVLSLAVFAVAGADEITGVVTKFEDGKVTFTDFKAMFGKFGEKTESSRTLPIAANAKFLNAKVDFDGGFVIEAGDNYEGGKDAFAKAVKEAAAKKKTPDKKSGLAGGPFEQFGGVFAQIVIDGEGDKAQITEIRVIAATTNKKKGPN